MKNQQNWYKPAPAEEHLSLPSSSVELFGTITKIKSAQIILQHKYHSFEKEHIGDRMKDFPSEFFVLQPSRSAGAFV